MDHEPGSGSNTAVHPNYGKGTWTMLMQFVVVQARAENYVMQPRVATSLNKNDIVF